MGNAQIDRRLTPTEICKALNRELAVGQYNHIRIAATKWTACGNLVVTAGHTNSEHQLNTSLTFIALHLKNILGITTPPNTTIPIRTNVKWSRLLLNRVPTGLTDDHGAYTPDTCHKALVAENPSYASLHITQRPSWVKNPTSYNSGSMSSLSFAFEDLDGSLTLKLLSEKELYIFGNVATIKKWKQKPPQKKPAPTPPLPEAHPPNSTQPIPETQAPNIEMRRSKRQGQARQAAA